MKYITLVTGTNINYSESFETEDEAWEDFKSSICEYKGKEIEVYMFSGDKTLVYFTNKDD